MPTDPVDAQLVRQFMLHNHPTDDRPHQSIVSASPLMVHESVDFVIPNPFSPRLQSIMRDVYTIGVEIQFRCHLNFEAASSSHLFQYLFKYIHKGPDRTRFRLFSNGQPEPVDEIQEYWDARYLSAGEATWRILGFHITKKEPGVSSLPVHIEIRSNAHRQYSHRNASHTQSLSLLGRYFQHPSGHFTHHDGSVRNFQVLTYIEYYTFFRLAKYDPTKINNPNYFEEQNFGNGASVHSRLQLKYPDHNPDDFWPLRHILDAAHYVLHGTRVDAPAQGTPAAATTSTALPPGTIKTEDFTSLIETVTRTIAQAFATATSNTATVNRVDNPPTHEPTEASQVTNPPSVSAPAPAASSTPSPARFQHLSIHIRKLAMRRISAQDRNLGVLPKPPKDKDAAYKTSAPVQDPRIAEDVFNRSMKAPTYADT
ncbi:hypothetical protein A0H81_02119 [Grifola frondosa]|uniref:Uncharacterized protein n=1 Tax=Grifola frondosa TaxID=5627 RepID=A0A1C7MM76_GRIFR|nr:hypothetical protein A0H81_02119 [Grifola frondosa]